MTGASYSCCARVPVLWSLVALWLVCTNCLIPLLRFAPFASRFFWVAVCLCEGLAVPMPRSSAVLVVLILIWLWFSALTTSRASWRSGDRQTDLVEMARPSFLAAIPSLSPSMTLCVLVRLRLVPMMVWLMSSTWVCVVASGSGGVSLCFGWLLLKQSRLP